MLWIEGLVGPHDHHQIVSLGQVDDIVGIARQHVNGLDLLPGYLKFPDLVRADLPFLDQAMAGNHHKKLPLGIMPVLALSDPGLTDVDGKLPDA